MKRPRSLRKTIALAILVLALGLLLTWFLLPPLPIDSYPDLQPVARKAEGGPEAFRHLKAAADLLVLSEEQKRLLSGKPDGKESEHDASLNAILEANRAALEELDLALQAKGWVVPPLERLQDPVDYLGPIKQLASLRSAQVGQLARGGRAAEGLERALGMVQWGRAFQDSGGPVLHFLVGTAIKSMGLSRIRQLASVEALGADELRRTIAALEPYRHNETILSNALKIEFRLTVRELEYLKAGKQVFTNAPARSAVFSVGSTPVFNLRRTCGLVAGATRTLLTNLAGHYSNHSLDALPRPTKTRSTITRILSGNAMGEMFYEMLLPSQPAVLAGKCRDKVNVEATRTVLALRLYQLQHGRLPESLAELVPTFLPEMPVDDFDGRPLRYSPQKKLLYSVDRDLVDSGGADSKQTKGADDRAFPIEF